MSHCLRIGGQAEKALRNQKHQKLHQKKSGATNETRCRILDEQLQGKNTLAFRSADLHVTSRFSARHLLSLDEAAHGQYIDLLAR